MSYYVVMCTTKTIDFPVEYTGTRYEVHEEAMKEWRQAKDDPEVESCWVSEKEVDDDT